jgi:hypothetical protein
MKMYGEVDVYIHIFLTTAVVNGEWLTSRHSPFIPKERDSDTYWIGGWVGPRTGLDDPYRDSNFDTSIVLYVASRNAGCAIRAPCRYILY